MPTWVVITLIVTGIVLAGSAAFLWFFWPTRPVNRRMLIDYETIQAQREIDELTRQAMRAMRDLVREEARTRQSVVVVEGSVIE